MSQTTIFHIPALDCPDELALVQRSLRNTPGVFQLLPDYLGRKLRVEFDPVRISESDILKAIESAGFPAQMALPVISGSPTAATDEIQNRASRVGTYVGGILLLAAVLARLIMGPRDWPVIVLAIASTASSGWPVAVAALRAIRLRALDMNVLMMVAGAGAIAIGDYFEAATAMFLFGISLWLERMSLRRAQKGIRLLLDLAPNVAHRVSKSGTSDEKVDDVHPDQLSIGEQVLVRPGERIPTDGEVLSGESAVNQAPITGESLPVDKKPGDRLFAGTLNGEGSLIFSVTKTFGNTTLAQIDRLVEEARTRRSPTERFVDAFARRYTPAVILLAVGVVVIPSLLGWWGVGWATSVRPVQWLERGLVLLVIACPCALVISTPVTIVSALYRATRLGILVKGGEFLERVAALRSVALDKTGTVTTGSMEVVAVDSFNGESQGNVLAIAAALERNSEHPLATAIVAKAQQRGIVTSTSISITAVRGFGVHGDVNGKTYFLGNPRLFAESGFQLSDSDVQRLRSSASGNHQGSTTTWLGTSDRLLGAIRLADHPRPGIQEAIADLRQQGVARVVMLTGDNSAAAQAIASEIGIDEVYAELLPQDKIEKVRSLLGNGSVAMIGDGVNDAPALAAADIGIALGGQSSDTALESADVVVMTPDLAKVAELVRLGRRCRRILKQNISFALASKLGVMLLAVAGMASMWMAVAADVGASMIVIANGMRMIGRRR